MNSFSESVNTLPSDWVSPTNMQNTANAYIKVYKDGTLQAIAGMTIAVFKENVCRGIKTLTGTRTYFALPISSDLSIESGFTFKFFDPANGGTIYDITESLDNFDCVNGYGSSSSTLMYNIKLTALSTPTSSSEFSVYPNPVNEVFLFKLNSDNSDNAKIDLYELQGKFVQTIYTGVANSSNSIEVTRDKSIANGMYLLKATIGDRQYITKVVLL